LNFVETGIKTGDGGERAESEEEMVVDDGEKSSQ
jgi:hypothetical protein